MENLSDQNLLLRIKHNDHDAFTILFGRYWKSMFRSARSRLNDSEIAQDLVQEIFIRIWQRRSTLQITGPLENYLMGSVRLSVINHFKSSKASENQLESALQRINILEDSIESLTDYLELEKTLEQAVELMPEMLKRVYEMRSENLSVKAIAGELGIADQTVRNYISEVSRRLRIVISQKFPEKHLTYILLITAMLNK